MEKETKEIDALEVIFSWNTEKYNSLSDDEKLNQLFVGYSILDLEFRKLLRIKLDKIDA